MSQIVYIVSQRTRVGSQALYCYRNGLVYVCLVFEYHMVSGNLILLGLFHCAIIYVAMYNSDVRTGGDYDYSLIITRLSYQSSSNIPSRSRA